MHVHNPPSRTQVRQWWLLLRQRPCTEPSCPPPCLAPRPALHMWLLELMGHGWLQHGAAIDEELGAPYPQHAGAGVPGLEAARRAY